GVAFEEAPFGAGLAVASSRVWQLPGYAEGAFLVQDPAQAHLLEFAAIPDGARVWDACGAPGGKAALLGLRCRVVTGELRRDRLGRLRETVTRVAPGVSLVLADARRPPLADGGVEVALVDAPCTATGSIARHPDARWRLSAKRIARSAERQAAILDGSAPVVRPGGLMVYLTCSLEPEENEQQVDGFLARHREFERDGDDLFIFPPDEGTDGGYAARLRRTR
ncbi:MAG: RsmB/NOP family class I SAM-dependent RNA methyltransferase, partial [Gemmatimonadota bacterium]